MGLGWAGLLGVAIAPVGPGRLSVSVASAASADAGVEEGVSQGGPPGAVVSSLV